MPLLSESPISPATLPAFSLLSPHFVQHCEQLAQQHFGLDKLRPAQRDVLQKMSENRFVLATLPTGAGKTLLYALPALIFNDGPVVVISPLISLMRDQARRMKSAQIPCAILTSEQSEDDRRAAWSMINNRTARLIFASPERFVLPSFVNAMRRLRPRMAVVDEAHCVVSWGHHFRPEYAEIGNILNDIAPDRILAITATASQGSREDIIRKVFPKPQEVIEYTSRPIAPHIYVKSVRLFSKEEQWETLASLIKTTPSQKSIVYFSTRKQCEEYALKIKKHRIQSVVYHAGLSKFERTRVEEYIHNSAQKIVICATTAFGMGVDISGIELVIIYGFPGNIEEFFQMLGRAGRGGEPSQGVLLWTGSDPIRRQYQFKQTFPTPAVLLSYCAAIMGLLPGAYGEKIFVKRTELAAKCHMGEQKDINRHIDHIISAFRICGCVEEPLPQESYIQMSLHKKWNLSLLAQELPPGTTKRSKVIHALHALSEKEWLEMRGAKGVFSMKRIVDFSELTEKSVVEVLSHYAEKDFLQFSLIAEPQAGEGFIFKHGYVYFQKQLPKYVAAREHFAANLSELEKCATATQCRLSSSFAFFLGRSVQGATNRGYSYCMQCDLCLKRSLSPESHIQNDLFQDFKRLYKGTALHEKDKTTNNISHTDVASGT